MAPPARQRGSKDRRKQPKQMPNSQPAVPPALAAYGEQFMAMFDDYDETAQRDEQQLRQQHQTGGDSDSGSSSSEDDGSGGGEQQQAQARRASHASAGPSPRSSKPLQPAGASSSRLEAFLSGRRGSAAGRGQAGPAATPPTGAQQAAARAAAQQQRLLEAQLRRQFMSSKVSKIFADVDTSQLAQPQPRPEGDPLSPEEFARMRRDVEQLGASALDKRSAKAWKAAQLAKLGASAEKRPRTPAKIGHGMARKAKQREAAALAEAIAAGMAKAKGCGAKARKEKARGRDRGLQEAGPGFRHGVLRVAKPRQ